MRVDLLGPLRVRDDSGAEIAVPAGRQRALLIRLAQEPGRLVPAAVLIDALWPGEPPANAPGALQTQVSRLRGRIGDRLAADSGGYRLTDTATDAAEFERLAAQTETAAREQDAGTVRHLAGRALELWRGPALAGVADLPFAEAEATRLTARREAVAALLVEARLELEGAAAVLAELAARHGADPLSEPDAGRYMRALAASGRQAEALDVYEKLRSRLADELGIDPSPALARAHLDVLRGIETAPAAETVSHLPRPLTDCIGREHDLTALRDLVDANRLVTLTGPGGTGKTRLVIEAGHRIEQEGTGVRLVELAPVNDAGRLDDVFLDALGLSEPALSKRNVDARERLAEALRNRRMVLIVDNCEHLIDAVAALAAHLLPRAPVLRMLATSREPLGLTGEAVFNLGPLSTPDSATAADAASHSAVRLFVERGRQSDSSFALSAANAGTVVGICAALDGLPLSIELAAARLRSMSLEDLASRLDDRFTLLNRGDRTAAPRQRSLRGVVDWSWDLLDEHERRVLARLSVFNGGADLDAACEVCSADADDIRSLVDKSLVQRLPRGRYRLLETVREYSAERLAEFGETARAYLAHAEYFARLAERAAPYLQRAEQVEWLDRLAADHENLTAAIRRMIAAGNARLAHQAVVPISWYWWMRGYRKEGQELSFQVRDMEGPVEPVHRAGAHLAGMWALWSGLLDPDEVAAGYAEAERIIEEHDLYEVDPLLKMVPVLRALLSGDETALRAVGAGLDRERDAHVRGMVLLFCSEYSARAGKPEQALAELTESNAIFTALGERFGIIMSLQALASTRTAEGDHVEARRMLLSALEAESELGADRSDSVIVENVWRIDAEFGADPEAVLAQMRVEEEGARQIGNFENVIGARTSAAVCLRRLGKLTEARDELLAAEAGLPEYINFSEVSLRLYRHLAEVARELGDRELEARAAEKAEGSLWPFTL
ncbi:BTAD domain-containing putative transcriptional regulator [Glycomyces buryatensis]|uniref:AfsR/SARP family transcriptional regulator n=1 Tax=Glycomyces buryatensis TaxID=2570927 RepID=A0A4S8Q780_9ACTN|nr:BTAD domain-containing putative transcriptional regulator [Glycomyces buryatensis]THV38582.1 AfsR/SARP family transcriptional regulator [Glycomyces buryatensis]